ncbi:MAG: hypothetical protein JWP35_3551 [Caulobacter sp.]|nr:hypothetical protein [Caulobacter sp.]
MSFARPTLSTLIERVRDDLNGAMPGADSRLRRSVLGVIARVVAAVAHGLYGYQAWIAKQVFPDTAEEEQAVRWASIFGLGLKPAVASTGPVAVAGTAGTVPINTLLQRRDEAQYITTAAASLVAGVATLTVRAVSPGEGGDAGTGTILEFVSPVAGVNAQGTVAAPGIKGGLDQESPESLTGRLLDRMRDQPNGGSATDYERWAKEVPEVTRVWVYPESTGVGTVGILFVMDGRASIFPLAGDVTAVGAYIAARRPVTAQVTVAAPTSSATAFTIQLTPNTPEVQAAVTESLKDLYAREAEPGGTIKISHIREAVSQAAGETDNLVTAPSANVVASGGQLKTVGVITFSAGP